MRTIENNEDFNNIMNQEKPIVLDFYADWCRPCQALLPTVEKLSGEYEGLVEIHKVNVDQYRELAVKFEVKSIPVLFFIKDGQIVDKLNGLVSENVLREKINSLYY
ncbi:MAG: thioredoxin [Bacteroidetes bacterium HGW-Bacteroidetes-18]|nr:MAG: thioredoxin [Bacteroidetes bacterium HGW-Bacteroidetes-18]